jgi:hypothetical protein
VASALPGSARPASCSARSLARRVDETPDLAAPELGDLLVVGGHLDDRAQQQAVLAVDVADALRAPRTSSSRSTTRPRRP